MTSRSRVESRLLTWLLLGAVVFTSAPAPAWAAYVVQRGDVLFVSIAEDRDAGREARVNADGRIMLPYIGGVMAAGTDLDAIRGRIESALTDEGIIRKPTVVVEVSKYRPVYVGGDVTRPGAIGFEVGLTVRQALVLAGGIDSPEGPDQLTTEDLLELKARFKVNAADLVDVDSRIARLRAELAETSDMDASGVAGGPSGPELAEPILSLEAELLRDVLATRASERAHFEDLVRLTDFEIEVLGRQASLQEEEEASQQSEVDAARKLYEQGLVPLPRVQELERERSRLRRDLLESRAFAARARQYRATSEYELATARTTWRLELREKLRDALLDRAKLKAESEAIAGGLVAAGISLVDNGRIGRAEPEIVIHRKVGGQSESIRAGMETEILPADVLEVSVEPGTTG